MKKAPALMLCLLLMCSCWAWSDVIFDDPATIHVGPGNCGDQSLTGCGDHPNLIGNSGLVTLYQNSGGNIGTPLSPVLLILAVANATNPNLFSSSSITSVSFENPLGGAPTPGTASYGGAYGLSGSGYQGSMAPTPGDHNPDVYTFLCSLGLQPGGSCSGLNNSNNWDNLTGALSANTGISANGFGIYVFSIFGSLGAKGLINIQFGDPPPGGTFVLGYAQTSTTKKNDTLMKIFSTPFTESGLTVPEPGTLALMLFGSGLVGAAGVLRRRFF